MASTFTLWDLEAGNLVGAFDTEAAARAVAERALADQGPESVETLALVREDEQRELTTIAEGLDLVRGKDQGAPRRQDGPDPAQASSDALAQWVLTRYTSAMDVRRLPLPSEPLLTVVASCRQQGRGLLDLWSLPVKLPSGPVVDGSFCDYALARLGRYQP